MTVCIPVDSTDGLQSVVSEQFEQAKFYLLISPDTRGYETVANNCSSKKPLAALAGHYINAAIVKKIESSSAELLAERKVEIFRTKESNVTKALDALMLRNHNLISRGRILTKFTVP